MVTLHGKDYEWQLCGVCGSREIVTHKPRGEPDVAIVLQMVNLMHKRCYVTHKPRCGPGEGTSIASQSSPPQIIILTRSCA